METLIAAMCALFVPGSGIARCLRYLLLHPGTTRKDELKRALRAGALCMVVKAKGVKEYVIACQSLLLIFTAFLQLVVDF